MATPTLRDLYSYTGFDVQKGPTYSDNGEGQQSWGMNDYQGNPVDIAGGGHWEGGGDNAHWVADGPDMSKAPGLGPDDPLSKYVHTTQQQYNTDSGQNGYQFDVDYSALPKTKFGGVQNTWAVDDMNAVNDPSLVYDDPNYGKITHKGNLKQGTWDKINQIAPSLMMAAGTYGMGLLGMPGYVMPAINALRGWDNGGSLKDIGINTAASLAGSVMGGGGLGLPPEAMDLVNMIRQGYGYYTDANKLYNMYKYIKDS